MTSLGIAQLVLTMKPKTIFCNEYSQIEWMLAKAFELGLAAGMSASANLNNKKDWGRKANNKMDSPREFFEGSIPSASTR